MIENGIGLSARLGLLNASSDESGAGNLGLAGLSLRVSIFAWALVAVDPISLSFAARNAEYSFDFEALRGASMYRLLVGEPIGVVDSASAVRSGFEAEIRLAGTGLRGDGRASAVWFLPKTGLTDLGAGAVVRTGDIPSSSSSPSCVGSGGGRLGYDSWESCVDATSSFGCVENPCGCEGCEAMFWLIRVGASFCCLSMLMRSNRR